MQPDQLVAELLARGDINDDTTLELNRMLQDWRSGKLDPDDEAYLRDLHARVLSLPAEDVELTVTGSPAQLDGLSIDEWRDRALQAEAKLVEIEDAARNG